MMWRSRRWRGYAWDSAGNLYLASIDEPDKKIRRILDVKRGVIDTLRHGTTGFSGRGGPALSRRMECPHSPHFDQGQSSTSHLQQPPHPAHDTQFFGLASVAAAGLGFQSGMDLEWPALDRSLGSVTGSGRGPRRQTSTSQKTQCRSSPPTVGNSTVGAASRSGFAGGVSPVLPVLRAMAGRALWAHILSPGPRRGLRPTRRASYATKVSTQCRAYSPRRARMEPSPG